MFILQHCEKKTIIYKEHNRSAAFTHLKSNSLIRFCSQKQILPATIRRLDALFISRHETMPGSDSFSDLWVVNLMNGAKGTGTEAWNAAEITFLSCCKLLHK